MVAGLRSSSAKNALVCCKNLFPALQQRSMTEGKQQALVACNVYVSEAHNQKLLSRLKVSAYYIGKNHIISSEKDLEHMQEVPESFPKAKLAYSFSDVAYNRSSFTIVGVHASELVECVVRLVVQAAASISLKQHQATHPRLGAIDHVVCQYLPSEGEGAEAAAVAVAHDIAAKVSEGLPTLPVVLYGAACGHRRRLQDIRRACGYFKGAGAGQWEGTKGMSLGVVPDFGPEVLDEQLGMCTVGAVPLVTNYNILTTGLDITACKKVAKDLSERGGGLQHVEAMALPHGDGMEVACNLLRADITPPTAVLQQCADLVQRAGGAVKSEYVIGLSPENLQNLLPELL